MPPGVDVPRRTRATRTVLALRGVGALLLTVAAVEYLLLPRLVEARAEVPLLTAMSAVLLVPALVLQAASLTAYTCLTQVILRGGPSLPFGTQLRIDLTGYGTSHVVPGGGGPRPAALPVDGGARCAEGRRGSLAAVRTVLAVLGLLVVATVGQVLTALRIGVNPLTLGLVVAVLVALTAGGSFIAHEPPTVRTARRFRALVRLGPPRRPGHPAEPGGAARGAHPPARPGLVRDELAARRRLLLGLPRRVRRGDVARAGALGVRRGRAGRSGPGHPGRSRGLEGTLVPALVVLGGASGPVVLGVLTWRLLQFWLPVPVAAVAWLSLRWTRARTLAAAPSGGAGR